MERTALFPGSFDPFTAGHLAVARRGLDLFDRLVIGVGVNPGKKPLLEPEARVELIRKVFERESRVEVAAYDTLTGDFCRQRGIGHILRGLRDAADFESERQMALAGETLWPGIATVCVFTPAEYLHVSSRLVREIWGFGGDVAAFMPEGIDIGDYL